jgi:hypothetical protein
LVNLVVQVLTTAGIGLVLLIVLWPRPARAALLLERWGVSEPDPLETNEALRYLKLRRILYPGLVVTISLGTSLYHLPGDAPLSSTVLASLLVGGLLAETAADGPWRPAQRGASVVRRRMRDLVPVWSIWMAGLLLGALVVLAAVAGDESERGLPLWSALLLGFGSAAAAATIVWLAVRRPSPRRSRADEALRLRSARVGIGLAMAAFGAIAASVGAAVGLALGVLGIVGWLAVTAPVRARVRPGRGTDVLT